MAILEVKNVSIRYKLGDFKDIGFKEYVLRQATGNYQVTEFWADRHVSFSLERGDMLGIIGTNGAGKSTLLKAVSGIMEPTEGYIKREGNVSALLELASGFDGNLTVKENAYLRGAMLGYTRQFMDKTYDSIIDFAGLKDFEDRPFKQLSSGMKARLAFAVASLVQPDLLILDEVLSVGDGAFRKKSQAKMREIIANGATTILVTHSISLVKEMCNKVLWLHKGEQIAFGENVKEICDAYIEMLAQQGESTGNGDKGTPSSVQEASGSMITVQPKPVTAPIGSTAKFKIEAAGKWSKFQWQFYDTTRERWRNITNKAYNGTSSDVLSVPAVKSRNGMRFRCTVSDVFGSINSEEAVLTVVPAEPLAIVEQPKSISVVLGEKAVFRLKATGSDLKYRWQYLDVSKDKWFRITSKEYIGLDSTELSFPAYVSRNGVRYRCLVTDPFGSICSEEAVLTVVPAEPLAIVEQPKSMSVALGEKAVFSLKATGSDLKYRWQYFDVAKDKWFRITSKDYTGLDCTDLSFPAYASRNGVRYRCLVTDPFRCIYSEEASLTVVPIEPLMITDQTESVTAGAFETVCFSVSATGQDIQYQWQFYDGKTEKWHALSSKDCVGASTSTVQIPALSFRNGIQYRCRVSDAFGAVFSEPVFLYQIEKQQFDAFISAMKIKAESLGMNDTSITSPSGLNKSTVSSAFDLLKMVTAAYRYVSLKDIWGKKNKTISVQGPNARTIRIVSTVSDKEFEDDFHIIGGKTGTLERADEKVYLSLVIVAEDRYGRIFAGSVLNASNRWGAMKALFDKMSRAANEPGFDPYSTLIGETEACIGWELKKNDAKEELLHGPVLYFQNADHINWTASTINTLSMITALDYINDLDEEYIIKESDVKTGSGNVFLPGDHVRIRDLVFSAMLPSSNTAANAIAHYVGDLLLEKKTQNGKLISDPS